MHWSSSPDACTDHSPRGAEDVPAKIDRILRISRVVSDVRRAERFYRAALGFELLARGPVDRQTLFALGAPQTDAAEVRLRLGLEELALVEFASPGRAYPADGRSDDLWFQHVAIVVRDMDVAYAALEAYARRTGAPSEAPPPEWRPISRCGPQALPPSSGGVRAFKFRDPDDHPLELLWFPPASAPPRWQDPARSGAAATDAMGSGDASPGDASPADSLLFLGIDHTALTVSATPESLSFYRALGLHLRASTLNEGPAQSRLDGLDTARVQVSALRPACAEGPGIELLEYRAGGRRAHCAVTDVCTDWIVAAATGLPAGTMRLITDPDGHRLLLIDTAQ